MNPSEESCIIFWFRRDLRLDDNYGLSMAVQSGLKVLPIFIFDTGILSGLDPDDLRVSFIYKALGRLQEQLRKLGSGLLIESGSPADSIQKVCSQYKVSAVFTNHDYEPYAMERDNRVGAMLRLNGIDFQTFKDQVLFEKDEVLSDSGKPYTVFTPYARKWLEKVKNSSLHVADDNFLHPDHFYQFPAFKLPALDTIGFRLQDKINAEPYIDEELIRNYHLYRDIPSKPATTRLSVHLRFGTVSIRKLVKTGLELNSAWLNELIWREFFMQILWHFPRVVEKSFKPQYEGIQWRNDESDFLRWTQGNTGYPLVDAGMRELNATGFMHNRVRMVAAGFLVKHLLVDWRWGETYFANHLLDYELSSNNGNWQWAAGCGCDAAPYFRIFNPVSQAVKFDPDQKYIRYWIPEFGTPAYPLPVIDHTYARNRCLEAYKAAVRQI